MADADRIRWDARYAQRDRPIDGPASAVVDLEPHIPTEGAALDLAGGDGRHAIWLARRGLDVTLTDVSSVALQRAADLARREGLTVRTVALDLETDPIPAGPWTLALCTDYLQRDLWPRVAPTLASGGRILWVHPTRTNLERHPKPSARFLLAPGEAPTLIPPSLTILHSDEGWYGTPPRHLARIVASSTD